MRPKDTSDLKWDCAKASDTEIPIQNYIDSLDDESLEFLIREADSERKKRIEELQARLRRLQGPSAVGPGPFHR